MRSHAQTARAGHIGLVYTTAVILAGAAVLTHSAWSLSTHPVSRTWIALLVLTVASGLATLRVPGMPISFSISDIFSIGSALAFGPSAGAVTAAVDGLVLSVTDGAEPAVAVAACLQCVRAGARDLDRRARVVALL